MIPEWAMQALPPLPVLAALAGATFVGGLMRGFTGFGAGLLMAPVFSLLMPPTYVLVVILLLNLLTTIQMLPGALRIVDWKLVLRLFLPSLLGLPLGLAMLHMVDPVVMRKTVGIVVTAVAVLMLAGWHYKGRRGVLQDTATGAVSGFMTAIAGIGGPPIILYLLSIPGLSSSVLRAVSLVYFSFAQVATLTPLTISGTLRAEHLVYVAVLLPVSAIASMLGSWLHRWSVGRQQDYVRIAALYLLLLTGLAALVL
ncbi:MAG: sulfite exporter TauE/SafE family protein [Burkholderiaceae bacterium]